MGNDLWDLSETTCESDDPSEVIECIKVPRQERKGERADGSQKIGADNNNKKMKSNQGRRPSMSKREIMGILKGTKLNTKKIAENARMFGTGRRVRFNVRIIKKT